MTVFSHFGEITDIAIDLTENYAHITFAKILDAFLAQQSLNKYQLPSYNLTLLVRWLHPTASNTLNPFQMNN